MPEASPHEIPHKIIGFCSGLVNVKSRPHISFDYPSVVVMPLRST